MRCAVVLYGPPASGKDTVTAELLKLDERYVAYQRLKVGAGRTDGYRVVSAERFRMLEEAGELLYRNSRYGNVYGVDRDSLEELIGGGRIPVLHLGQVMALECVTAVAAEWVRVLLWCNRNTARERSAGRGDVDTDERLLAWDATKRDVDLHPELPFDLRISTDCTAAKDAARAIHDRVIVMPRKAR